MVCEYERPGYLEAREWREQAGGHISDGTFAVRDAAAWDRGA